MDILETISVILAPSGRPISAISSGSIAFTAKISGTPDLILALNVPGGSSTNKGSGITRTIQSPVFHPCVRLARWKEHPGELSFVPPDGRFVLAGYEVDLLPSYSDFDNRSSKGEKLFLPVTLDLRTGLGEKGCDFEVRLTINTDFPGMQTSSKAGNSRSGGSTPFTFPVSSTGSSNTPSLEAVVVSVPLPDMVRSVMDLRPSRGEAYFQQINHNIEWKVSTKDVVSTKSTSILQGTLIGPVNMEDAEENVEEEMHNGSTTNPLLGYYDEDSANVSDPFQASNSTKGKTVIAAPQKTPPATQQKRLQANMALMPRSASVSFNVRGWLASGIRVESLVVDSKRSTGIPSGMTPYKGVKYVTVSRKSVERRA